ncbi:MAG: rhomboid family intramembrane serine protease [Actinobacteria bacterium]|nr:MAG: rhomboid family intramembrane serine protease [Actinomycetota bacterium]
MSSGADLFVVCKHCGSEVSPYITECPYCGHRLRQRAPKIPRETARRGRRGSAGLIARLRARPARRREATLLEPRRPPAWARLGAESRPFATITVVALSCGAWIAWRGGFVRLDQMMIEGPLHGDWWKLLSSQFTYENGWYEFAALVVVALFGWLVERRHGPAVLLALFLGAGATGALVALAAYPFALVSGANAGALALLAAWSIPDLAAARAGEYYEGDLLGTGALAAVLLAVPFARPEVSWLAGLTGGALGALFGIGLHRASARLA